MTPIELARDAGLSIREHYDELGSTPVDLARFAALVIKQEHERLAKGSDLTVVATRWPSVPGSHTYAGSLGCNHEEHVDEQRLVTLRVALEAIAAARVQEREVYRPFVEFVARVSKQNSSCGQCECNESEAEDLIDAIRNQGSAA